MRGKHIAMCGLDCGCCAAFIATKNDDNILREKTAQEWSKIKGRIIKPEDINCFGCLTENKPMYKNCLSCGIKKCGIKKKIKNCKECESYKCEKLVELQKRFF